MGVDFQTYRDVVQAFAGIVDERIRVLESADDACQVLDHSELSEGADLIGAERLSAVIRRIESMGGASCAPDVLQMQQSMLLRELKLLKPALDRVVAHS
jgi:hypothetical protein